MRFFSLFFHRKFFGALFCIQGCALTQFQGFDWDGFDSKDSMPSFEAQDQSDISSKRKVLAKKKQRESLSSDGVEIGWRKTDVLRNFGQPVRKERNSSLERWSFIDQEEALKTGYQRYFYVFFKNDQVIAWDREDRF